MFDLDRVAITITCPKCNFDNSATVRQVRVGDRVICRGCKNVLCLVDRNASFKKGRSRMSEEIESLRNAWEIKL